MYTGGRFAQDWETAIVADSDGPRQSRALLNPEGAARV